MKDVYMPRMDCLDTVPLSQVASRMQVCPHVLIQEIDWPNVSDYRPLASVRPAWSSTGLYLMFNATTDCMRAVHTANQSPVCQDDCVEFFMRLPESTEYWNFEFNCIGTVNASRRVRRDSPTRLTEDEIASIGRWPSTGHLPFESKPGENEWHLVVKIPFELLGLTVESMPSHIMANFYKCGDRTSHPHYLSWQRVHTEHPNFHRIEDFSPIYFAH